MLHGRGVGWDRYAGDGNARSKAVSEAAIKGTNTDMKKNKVRRDEIGKASGMVTMMPAGMARPVSVDVTLPTRNDTRNLYGATENRRVCHACGSANSTVESVRRLARFTVRYRICSDCGAKRTTQEIAIMSNVTA